MPELVLVRHGRTAWNKEGRVQGHLDVELDDSGREQAAAAAEALALLQPKVLWSSDLLRARDTAGYLATRTGLTPTYDARLREYNLGERQGITREEFEAIAPEEFALFRQGYYDETPGAESTGEVRERMLAALGEVLAQLGPTDTGVVFGHGAAIRVAVGALLDWPEDLFRSLGVLDNCGWLVLAPHPLTGRLRLAAYNRTAGSWTPPDEARLVPQEPVG